MSQFFPPDTRADEGSDEGSDEPVAPRGRGVVVAIALVAAVAVLALAVLVPVLLQNQRTGQRATTASGADLGAVKVYADLPRDHVQGHVDYDTTPPVGGPHDPEWLDCGAYDAPVRNENAVHDLEHGAVWIAYAPDLGRADVATLAAALPDNGLLSPYDGLPAPVVVTVWGRQLALTGADDPRLKLFVDAFSDGHTAPEPFASCAGGIHGTADDGSQSV